MSTEKIKTNFQRWLKVIWIVTVLIMLTACTYMLPIQVPPAPQTSAESKSPVAENQPILAIFDPAAETPEQYDQITQALEDAGTGSPQGRLYHLGYTQDDGSIVVVDVWASGELLDQFTQKLVPPLLELGLTPVEPQIYPIYDIIKGGTAVDGASPSITTPGDYKMSKETQTTTNDAVSFTSENVTYGRYYADADGESHFGKIDLALVPIDLPVGPPLGFASFSPAKEVIFLHIPAGYSHDWLTVSARTLWFHIAGEMEVTVSDGETRRFPAGSIVLAEDTMGKGHRARVVSESDVLLVGVELPE